MKAITLTTLALVLLGTVMSAAHNVSGTITCDSQGVAGVAVSDGYEVVTTDANGHYEMTSNKANGYVFYTLPRGYEPLLADGFMPQFWSPLSSMDTTVPEVHDFTLRGVRDNDNHIVIFGADTHLARRNSDRAFFKKGFITSLNDEVERAGDTPIYSILLGDLIWDVFWYANDYSLSNFVADMKSWHYPMTLWSVIGNHDHDPSVLASATTDQDSARPWHDIMGPNYYSFNLGQVHYVVLDDIIYLNEDDPGEDYAEGVVGNRNYKGAITDEQFEWLRKDLALIPYTTPVVVCLHIPAWNINSNFNYSPRLENTYELCSLLNKYNQAHIVSGHTHINYNVNTSSYRHVTEHCLDAVSGSLWWSAALSGHHICQDGSPAGYSRWTVNGKNLQWTFKPIHEGESQMRLYDMNTVRDFYFSNSTMRAIMNQYPSRVNYANIEDNLVMVNVFAYEKNWKVNICEGNKMLECDRVYTEDPFHTLAYDYTSYSTVGYYTSYYATIRNTHMFRAKATTSTLPITVRIIDGFGNVMLKSINRPHNYNLSMEKYETMLTPGDVNADNEISIADVNLLIDMVLSNGDYTCPPVLADCNGDGEVTVSDINYIINLIINS